MLVQVSPEDRFRIWYIEPLEKLESIPRGNGAILALTVIMPLYERVYRFEKSKNHPNTNNRNKWVMNDLNLNSEDEAKFFWNVFRDGLCHTGSFFEQSDKPWTLPKIGLDVTYPALPTFTKTNTGEDAIILNPWKFVQHILKKYKGNKELLEYAPAPLLPLHYSIKDTTT